MTGTHNPSDELSATLEKSELPKIISLIFDQEAALRSVRKVLENIEYGEDPHPHVTRPKKSELPKIISLIFDQEAALRSIRKVLEAVEYGKSPQKIDAAAGNKPLSLLEKLWIKLPYWALEAADRCPPIRPSLEKIQSIAEHKAWPDSFNEGAK